MPRFALVAALALVACSGDPSPSAANDAAADVAVDAAPPPDAPQDAAPPPDLTPPADVAPPPPDAGPDNGPDVRTDTGPDVAPDAPRDVAGELADVAPDRADATAPDPLIEQVSAVRVTVTAPGYEWLIPTTQACDVTGGVTRVSAEYTAPERATFTFLGPSTLGMIGASGRGTSDVRAELRMGPAYLTDGESIRRMNVQVRGQIPGGLALTLTAQGCVVR
jgi:hypothetical protein